MLHMDKMSHSSRELAQCLYDKNVELENKRRRSAQARVPSDPNTWQQMRENYEAIILEDHTFSERHNIEYALWQLHYRRIEEFRAHISSALASASSNTSHGGRAVPVRPDRITKIRVQFKNFLSEATGFYHDLILKIRVKYGLPLGDFEDSASQIDKGGDRSVEKKKGLLSCHRCLIYLGDLARYKGLYGEGGDSKSRDYAAASSYYLQAASLWPPSGNPHHQLAILATYSGDEFVAVYRYFRSLAVDSPFSTARDNLIVVFEKNRQSYSQLREDTMSTQATVKGRGKAEAKVHSKDSINDTASIHEPSKAFCVRFVRLNGILFTRTCLEIFVEVLSLVTGGLHELLSSGQEEVLNFGTDAAENGLFIVRLIAILIFTIQNVSNETEDRTYADIVQRNLLLQNALTAVFEIMGHILNRCIELNDPSSSYLLPGILVFVEWLACCTNIVTGGDVDDRQSTLRTSFWNRFIVLLNKLLLNGPVCLDDEDESCFSNMSRYDEGESENRLALWEDFELRGFTPLIPAQTILNFSRKYSFGGDHKKEKNARVIRILAAGKALSEVVTVGQEKVRFDSKLKKFVVGTESQTSDDLKITPDSGISKSTKKFVVGTESQTSDDFKITPYLGSSKSTSKIQDIQTEDEEDEVIVFKPTVIEKRREVIASKQIQYEGLETGQNTLRGDYQSYGRSGSGPHVSLHQETGFNAGSQLPLSVANTVPQHLQSIESHSSMQVLDQQSSFINGFKGLNISGDGLMMKTGIRDVSTSVAALVSSSATQSIGVDANGVSYGLGKVPENVIQSNVDILPSGVKSGSLASSVSSVLTASSRKSPVNRPVRHLGPPPGFCSIPPKQVNALTAGLDSRGDNPLTDDYSWLDGYRLPSSIRNSEVNQFASHSSPLGSQYIGNGNGSVGTLNFPFPGKQIQPMQLQVEAQNGWHNNQTMQMNLNQEQGNLQVPGADQYQVQSIWTGRHFV